MRRIFPLILERFLYAVPLCFVGIVSSMITYFWVTLLIRINGRTKILVFVSKLIIVVISSVVILGVIALMLGVFLFNDIFTNIYVM